MMNRLFLFFIFLLAVPFVAHAEATKIFKIEAEVDAGKLKGVPCVLRAGGQTTNFTTPAKVEIAIDAQGIAILEELSCRYKGAARQIGAIADGRTVKVVMDFEESLGPALFYKSNGGLSAYMKEDGQIVTVR